MESRLRIHGHPIHPMMVNLPIGLYGMSFLCDLVFLWLGDVFWFRMAFWLIVVGILGHAGAAVTGLPDYLVLSREPTTPAFRTARLHLLTGAALFILYLINLALRMTGGMPPEGQPWLPVFLNLAGNGLLGLQGWFGGELVYRHGVGVKTQ